MSENLNPIEPEAVQPPIGFPSGDKPVSLEQPAGTGADFDSNYQRIADSAGKQMTDAAEAIRRGEFISDSVMDPTANSDDKLVALLAYLVPVLLPIIVLLSESSEKRPFQRYHAVQSLGLTGAMTVASIALGIATSILGVIPGINVLVGILMLCLTPILFLMAVVAVIYYGMQAYQGKRFAIPVVTTFLANQGWI